MSTTEVAKLPLTTVTAANVEFEIEVSTDGKFSTTFKGDEYEEDNLARLTRKLSDVVRTSKLEVPFVSDKGRSGIMRGWHATKRELLVTWDDGTKARLDTYARVFRPEDVTTAMIAEIQGLLVQARSVQERLNELQEGAVRAEDMFNEAFGEDLRNWKRYGSE
jgi:hypothetical protein